MMDDARQDETEDLPVTAEVGSEGGSYTDAIQQEATREGDLGRVDEAAESQPVGEHARATLETNDDPDDGVHLRHPPGRSDR